MLSSMKSAISQDRGDGFYQRSCDCSENRVSDLFPNVPGRDFWDFRLFERWYTSDEVHLVPLADLGLFDELVTKVQGKEDGNVGI